MHWNRGFIRLRWEAQGSVGSVSWTLVYTTTGQEGLDSGIPGIHRDPREPLGNCRGPLGIPRNPQESLGFTLIFLIGASLGFAWPFFGIPAWPGSECLASVGPQSRQPQEYSGILRKLVRNSSESAGFLRIPKESGGIWPKSLWSGPNKLSSQNHDASGECQPGLARNALPRSARRAASPRNPL